MKESKKKANIIPWRELKATFLDSEKMRFKVFTPRDELKRMRECCIRSKCEINKDGRRDEKLKKLYESYFFCLAMIFHCTKSYLYNFNDEDTFVLRIQKLCLININALFLRH